VDQLVIEVDVSPVEAQQFALPQSTEDGCRKESCGVPPLREGVRSPRG
jgi:hypothetical protein